jgi:hypothetical protein
MKRKPKRLIDKKKKEKREEGVYQKTSIKRE